MLLEWLGIVFFVGVIICIFVLSERSIKEEKNYYWNVASTFAQQKRIEQDTCSICGRPKDLKWAYCETCNWALEGEDDFEG